MVWAWQLWLSPRPVRRTETPIEPRQLSPNNAALYEYTYEDDGRLIVKETHYENNTAVREGRSGPPLHIHLRQTEYFEVLQGKLAVVKNEKERMITSNDGILEIPPGTRHRFWAHSSIEEDLVFKVWTMPQDLDLGFDENYLRNILGYLRDCQQQEIDVSVFQMALLGWSSDTLFICPPFYVPLWILKPYQYILGHFIGGFMLG
ncbi:hypothetical protein N0V90_000435 [Kalmusia sp. IMI 367209]|nr:hypothetical protein N0V90_000435 [Kalmusia sp. IMI 367209]